MSHQNDIAKALARLKESGFKYTKRREQVLAIVAEAGRLISASEVHKIMRQDYPNMSYDTVYRNLYTFVDLDIIEITERHGEKFFLMHCDDHGHHHHHFICEHCGRIIELPHCPLPDVSEQLAHVTITGHRFEVYGLCEKCQGVASADETAHQHCGCGYH